MNTHPHGDGPGGPRGPGGLQSGGHRTAIIGIIVWLLASGVLVFFVAARIETAGEAHSSSPKSAPPENPLDNDSRLGGSPENPLANPGARNPIFQDHGAGTANPGANNPIFADEAP